MLSTPCRTPIMPVNVVKKGLSRGLGRSTKNSNGTPSHIAFSRQRKRTRRHRNHGNPGDPIVMTGIRDPRSRLDQKHFPAERGLVSRDRDLLNQSIFRVKQIGNRKMKRYRGHYEIKKHRRLDRMERKVRGSNGDPIDTDKGYPRSSTVGHRRRSLLLSSRARLVFWRAKYYKSYTMSPSCMRQKLVPRTVRRPSPSTAMNNAVRLRSTNTNKIQFTQRLPLGPELHMGKERCCLRGLDHLHGPTSHSICGNFMISKPSPTSDRFMFEHDESLRADLLNHLHENGRKLEHFLHRFSWMKKNHEHKNFTMFPEKRFFFSIRETTSTTEEVAIHTNPFTDLYAPIGTGWYTTIMKLPFLFSIRIGFLLASSGGSRSLLRQLKKDKLHWNR